MSSSAHSAAPAASLLDPKRLTNGGEPHSSFASTSDSALVSAHDHNHLTPTSPEYSTTLTQDHMPFDNPAPMDDCLDQFLVGTADALSPTIVSEPTTTMDFAESSLLVDSTHDMEHPELPLEVPTTDALNMEEVEADALNPSAQLASASKFAAMELDDDDDDDDDANDMIDATDQSKRSPKQGPTPQRGLSFNPAQLLNPRKQAEPAAQKQTKLASGAGDEPRKAATPPAFQFTSTNGYIDSDSETDGIAMGDFIERGHNLTARSDNPTKRQKLDHDELHKKKFSKFDAKSGGIISEHIKEKRRQANETGEHQIIEIGDTPEPGATVESDSDPEVVDLTIGDSKTRPLSPDDEVVCFGKLDGAHINMHTIPRHKDLKGWTADGRSWKSMMCKLGRIGGPNFVIHARDHYNSIFGTLDLRVARALAPLMDSQKVFPSFRVDARLEPHGRSPDSHFGDSMSDRWPVTVNIFGRRRHATAIGGELRKRNVYLGAPTGLPYGTAVFNPHEQDRQKQSQTRVLKYGSTTGRYITRTNEEVEKDINSVFGRVKNHDELVMTEPVDCVNTPLLDHQKQALTFMAEREKVHEIREDDEGFSMSLWRMKTKSNGLRIYYNVITGNEERTLPPPVLGGILADQMGLGKTLEALAHFASTLEEARSLTEQGTTSFLADGTEIPSVGTTLLICPKNVMTNWEEQIEAHLEQGSVRYHLYYGPNRTQKLAELRGYDMIITTYSTVSSELNRRANSVLKAASWFRIILDEGHMIREQSTLQSRAVCDLHAGRRWVLTGTPVQNKLEDFGALVKFLKLTPFDMPQSFSQYIIAPFKIGNPEGLPRLRTLVDVITLRRLKDRIDLLPREDTVMKLEFSKDERTLYNWVNQDAKSRVRLMEGAKKRGGRQMGGILRLISCLRMISDHGKELVREDELPDTKGISTDNPLVLDDDEQTEQPALMAHSAYEMYHLMTENDANRCIYCQNTSVAPSDADDDSDKVFGVMLRCYDLVCSGCVKNFTKAMQKKAVDGRYSCPMCTDMLDFSFFELTKTGVENAEAERAEAQGNPSKAKQLGRYEKPHTKTWALIGELNAICEENFVQQHDPPIKSVVFTEWTSHLDLLEIALKDHAPHIKYVRLDGSMTRKQQTAAMNALRDDNSVTLILISIRAGGVGITLTAASRVFVMEPQWNPAAEAQAIDRVHRLGQKRAVKVVRFIMADSIEEQIVIRQGMKNDLADLSMNRKAENIKDKMDRFRELFR